MPRFQGSLGAANGDENREVSDAVGGATPSTLNKDPKVNICKSFLVVLLPTSEDEYGNLNTILKSLGVLYMEHKLCRS